MLKRFRSKDDFLKRLVTVDETWVHYCEQENKAGLFTQEKYYANLLDQLRTAIREKRRGQLSSTGILLQQDNAKVYTCSIAMDVVERNGYELIPHSAYSPDLAPSDFFIFPILKNDTRKCHFRSDEEVVTAVEVWVNGKDPDFFQFRADVT